MMATQDSSKLGLAEQLLEAGTKRYAFPSVPGTGFNVLDVILHIAHGETYTSIAEQLCITTDDVERALKCFERIIGVNS